MTTHSYEYPIETEEILRGFMYSYRQLDAHASRVYEASAHLYSLIELLVAKGVIGIEELDQRKRLVEKRLKDSFKEADIGVKIEDSEIDKYRLPDKVGVDCENRRPICHAGCCMLTFPLSWQDIREGNRWNLGEPFLNARGRDGYCFYLQKPTFKCCIYEHRPAICRSYDCRGDHRIWLDFDKMIINPKLFVQETSHGSEKRAEENQC